METTKENRIHLIPKELKELKYLIFPVNDFIHFHPRLVKPNTSGQIVPYFVLRNRITQTLLSFNTGNPPLFFVSQYLLIWD
jgi:hypothetical protein